MARKPRIYYPGAVYHVILRGNAGEKIFFSDNDRYRFYLLLQEGQERFGYLIHAFCLMPNHVHLAFQVGKVPLSRILQNLVQRYTMWVNRREGRTGHVFQGRYKAILLDADAYLLELIRYIHLNPVRAGVARRVEDYPWSSYRAYLGEVVIPWLSTDWVLGQFSSRKNLAFQRFREFVHEGIGEPRRADFHKGTSQVGILGDEKFSEKVSKYDRDRIVPGLKLEELVRRVCLECGVERREVVGSGKQRRPAQARGLLCWLVREIGKPSLTELSRELHRDVSSLSMAINRLLKNVRTDSALRMRMERLKRDVMKSE